MIELPRVSEGQFAVGQQVSLPGDFAGAIVLEAVRPIGSGYGCCVGMLDGAPDGEIPRLDEAVTLFGEPPAVPAQLRSAEAAGTRLLIESARIRSAGGHDRHFAVSLSGIRTFPNQIEVST